MPNRRVVVADVYAHLKAVMMSLGRQMEAELKRTGMSTAQLVLLWRLVEAGEPSTPKQLAKALDVTAGNVTRLVEKLETMGYVTRTRSTTDLRVVHVEATPPGAGVFQKGFDAQAKVLTRAFGDWSDAEVAALRAMLIRLDPDVPPGPDAVAGPSGPGQRPRPKRGHAHPVVAPRTSPGKSSRKPAAPPQGGAA